MGRNILARKVERLGIEVGPHMRPGENLLG
jgi:hypothetical protein